MSDLPEGRYVRELPAYPFARLDARRRELEAKGTRCIDLGIGDPALTTPEFIRRSLRDSVPERAAYPTAAGTPGLRRAAAGWLIRRYGVRVDPDRELLPVNGSKEAIHGLALAVVDPETRPVVLIPEPAYPVYALGARAAGAEIRTLPLRPDRGYLPDLAAIPPDTWRRTALCWINYPHNPTGATASLAFFREAAALCREHGVLLASDEAYAEIYFTSPPPGALECGLENIVVFHTLSKRSAMAGYRSGFMAGDARLLERLSRMRPGMGVATPLFIQDAARVAWEDDAHVAAQREAYRERRDRALAVLREAGLDPTPPEATFFLWLRTPSGSTSEEFALRCLEQGVVVLPGSVLGQSGEGFIRISLTPEPEVLEEALARIAGLFV